jgi:signal transduction histidine kinase
MRAPQTLRARLTLAAVGIAVAVIAVVTASFNVVLERSERADANGRLRAQAAAAATTVMLDGGRVVPREIPGDAALDRQIWVYAGRHAVERPVAAAALQRAADALAGTSRAFRDVPSRDERLYAHPLTFGGRQVGTVVAGLSLAGYEHATGVALVGSLALAGLLLAAAAALSWIVVGRALAPVREMTRSVAAWSEHGNARRFGSTPRPAELGELAQTFDSLLDRIAASLRHEQRLSAELSHELRTPLARLTAEVELLRRRERPRRERVGAYAAIARSAQQMSGILETLMAAARAQAGLERGRCELAALLDELAGEWSAEHVAVEVRAPGSVVAGVDRDVVERVLAPLLDNACRYARRRILLSATRVDGRVVVSVADDGPGLPEGELERAFEPGVRFPGAGHAGAGLGLPLARRLARAAGGEVSAGRSPLGGAAFRVELPGA